MHPWVPLLVDLSTGWWGHSARSIQKQFCRGLLRGQPGPVLLPICCWSAAIFIKKYLGEWVDQTSSEKTILKFKTFSQLNSEGSQVHLHGCTFACYRGRKWATGIAFCLHGSWNSLWTQTLLDNHLIFIWDNLIPNLTRPVSWFNDYLEFALLNRWIGGGSPRL